MRRDDNPEIRRAELLVRLVQAEKVGAAYATKRGELEAEIHAKQAELARHLETYNPTTEEKIRAKLIALADPSIARALAETANLASKARLAFGVKPVIQRRVGGTYRRTISNSLEIAECLARIKTARTELESLQAQPRPDDLQVRLDDLLEPLRAEVARLNGF